MTKSSPRNIILAVIYIKAVCVKVKLHFFLQDQGVKDVLVLKKEVLVNYKIQFILKLFSLRNLLIIFVV